MRLLLIVGAILFAGQAYAGCTCQCVNGRSQPLCDSALSIVPSCMDKICPIDETASVRPLTIPRIPPIGTSACEQARVCDTFGNCRWQQVCR